MSKLTRRNFITSAAALAALAAVGVNFAIADEEKAEDAYKFDNADEVTLADDKKITVGASPTPHAEILNGPVKEILTEQGYELVVTEFTDYILPNTATEQGEVDANYFQHEPYLKSFNEENGTHLVPVCAVHYEHFGIYPGNVATLEEVSDGAKVAVPNDTTNEARALLLLEQEGLLKLKDGAGVTATTNDIAENPKNLEFVELEAANIPNALPDVAIACINGNYALDAGYTVEDALAIEAADGLAAKTYANVLVVHAGNEEVAKIQALKDALLSEKTYNFILDTFKGAVQPAFTIDGEGDEAETADGAEAAALKDGEYTAEGKGIGGKVPVTVTVKDGKIAEVTVGENSETQGIGSKAIEQLPAKIVEAGGTEGVDAVSGASVTSKAIFTAVEDCLEQAGTTDVAPAAATSSTHSDASASDNKTTDSSDSLIATTDDHLGTTRFGKMSITIPDTYTCEKFDQSPTSDGTQAVEAAYSRALSKTSAIFIKEVFLADAAADFDDPSFLIDLLVSADLEATSSDGSCETVEEMSQLGNGSYFGIYTIKLEGTDITVLGGGAVDEDGNLLLVRVFVLGNVDSDDVFEVVDSIEVNCAPESPSSSSSTSLSLSQSSRGLSGSSTHSSGSSYAPTRSEQNALNRANDYLEFMSFSRSGLIDQLEFEGYTTSEAEYAVDNCGADWDEQAVLKAEEYLDFMSFSRSGLIDQLEFEGFTYDQASAAATAVGL